MLYGFDHRVEYNFTISYRIYTINFILVQIGRKDSIKLLVIHRIMINYLVLDNDKSVLTWSLKTVTLI
jgi:hypothetical protein